MEVLKSDLDVTANETHVHCSDNSSAQCLDEEETDFLINVEEADDGKWRTCFYIDKAFFPCIIGSKGKTRKRIESETDTEVCVPDRGQAGNIVITGDNKFSVARARKRIKLVQKTEGPLTHFLSIPFNKESFQQGFLLFKDKVLESCHEQGINEYMFQSVDKLHLTLGVFVLCDDTDKCVASRILEECKVNIINPLLSEKSLLVEMSGIDFMRNNPLKVRVLYAKVVFADNPDLLQQLADSVVSYFLSKGIIKNERKAHVKLHVTLMNTSFQSGKPFHGKKISWTFDATGIMKNFADFHFGKALIDRIDLSLMPSLTPSSCKSGYYQAASSISLT